MLAILTSIVNINERTYMITNEHDNEQEIHVNSKKYEESDCDHHLNLLSILY